jgi:hypothetical protein
MENKQRRICHSCAGLPREAYCSLCDGPHVRKPDAWRVSISGNWEYFRTREQAEKELQAWQADYSPEELEEARADGMCEPEPVCGMGVSS